MLKNNGQYEVNVKSILKQEKKQNIVGNATHYGGCIVVW